MCWMQRGEGVNPDPAEQGRETRAWDTGWCQGGIRTPAGDPARAGAPPADWEPASRRRRSGLWSGHGLSGQHPAASPAPDEAPQVGAALVPGTSEPRGGVLEAGGPGTKAPLPSGLPHAAPSPPSWCAGGLVPGADRVRSPSLCSRWDPGRAGPAPALAPSCC